MFLKNGIKTEKKINNGRIVNKRERHKMLNGRSFFDGKMREYNKMIVIKCIVNTATCSMDFFSKFKLKIKYFDFCVCLW